MARWGKVDFKDLKKLQKKMQKFEEIDSEALCIEIAKNLAQRVYRSAVKRTPVISGDLRRAWTVSEVVNVGGATYEIEISNSMEYSSYVEHGHRQKPGKFIPGYWDGNKFIYVEKAKEKGFKGGMVLRVSWVKGRFMLTKAEQMVDSKKEQIIEKMLLEKLNEVFSND
nr:MAG TPA: type I neck protein [Caudoviricetes sp.]